MKLKRIIIIFVVIGVGLILWGLFLPAETGPTLNKNARCKVVMGMLQAEIGNYKFEFGSYPTGNCAQVIKKLLGDNPKKSNFFIPKIRSLTKLENFLILGERLTPSTFCRQTTLSFLRLAKIKFLATKMTSFSTASQMIL
jgi:hypothetical protein